LVVHRVCVVKAAKQLETATAHTCRKPPAGCRKDPAACRKCCGVPRAAAATCDYAGFGLSASKHLQNFTTCTSD
jgi:hypothetical protein